MVSQDLFFNKRCLLNNVYPKYIQVQIKNTNRSAQKTKDFAKKKWLKLEISNLYSKRDTLKLYIKFLHLNLTSILHAIEWDVFDDHVRSEASTVVFKKRQVHNKKN